MYLIISGTNRKGSVTLKVALQYKEILSSKGIEAKLLNLEELPTDFVYAGMYSERTDSFNLIQDQYLKPAKKIVFISPEYNGSIPGILKLIIDGSEIPECYYNKKACLVGVSSGRAGNLRGMDHLLTILQHVKMDVLPNKLPISKIDLELGSEGEFIQDNTKEVISKQLDQFIAY